jgi:hypothetical protein
LSEKENKMNDPLNPGSTLPLVVPLNQVGVVRLTLLDESGVETLRQMENIDWAGGGSFFSLVVAADGLSAEIHPTAVGTAQLSIGTGPLTGDGPSFNSARNVSVVAAVLDVEDQNQNAVRFVATHYSVVKAGVGRGP